MTDLAKEKEATGIYLQLNLRWDELNAKKPHLSKNEKFELKCLNKLIDFIAEVAE